MIEHKQQYSKNNIGLTRRASNLSLDCTVSHKILTDFVPRALFKMHCHQVNIFLTYQTTVVNLNLSLNSAYSYRFDTKQFMVLLLGQNEVLTAEALQCSTVVSHKIVKKKLAQ